MNVLVLTPDRVGSTLLQRLITVYMQMHNYGHPVINLHDLTNGLIKYYSPVFNQEVLGKPNVGTWGYYQSLQEVVELLHSVEHYKTARLAHYHIAKRQDSLAQQIPFYQYLNDNFFVISATRQNLLEHALSWGINSHSKKLNVYTHQEKIDSFADIYQNKITIDPKSLTQYLDKYVNYVKWVEDHFTVSSYFEYDTQLSNIEQYILGLDIFGGQTTKTWADTFGIEFKDWNRCHYLISDLSGISAQLAPPAQPKLTYSGPTEPEKLELMPVTSESEIARSLSLADADFVQKHASQYMATRSAIKELMENKVMVTGVPIKLQTMLEKRMLVRNFDQCVDVYNQWVELTGHGQPYSTADVNRIAMNEITEWHEMPKLT